METIDVRDLMAFDLLDPTFDYDGERFDANDYDAFDADADATIVAWVINGEI